MFFLLAFLADETHIIHYYIHTQRKCDAFTHAPASSHLRRMAGAGKSKIAVWEYIYIYIGQWHGRGSGKLPTLTWCRVSAATAECIIFCLILFYVVSPNEADLLLYLLQMLHMHAMWRLVHHNRCRFALCLSSYFVVAGWTFAQPSDLLRSRHH